jgi:TusA-related sulfurtransferase
MLANKFPYSTGWFANIKLTDYDSEKDGKASKQASISSNKSLHTSKGLESELWDLAKFRIRCFSVYPDYEITDVGGDCSETLSELEDLIKGIREDEIVHLVTDNPVADKQIPKWVSISGLHDFGD